MPPGEERFIDLEGAAIRADLETIVGFSKASRRDREVGSGQLWGRISGFPSSERTIEWTVDRFREAGIEDAEVQRLHQGPDASLWMPSAWEMTLVGDDRFGEGSGDIVLATAMPLVPSALDGPLDAPLVLVDSGGVAQHAGIDVDGKVAVQHVTPQAHTVFERGRTVAGARQLFERGAVAVVNLLDQPGHERARDFSNCGGPCFNLGGRDGRFLEEVIRHATDAGVADALRLRIRLGASRSWFHRRPEQPLIPHPGR